MCDGFVNIFVYAGHWIFKTREFGSSIWALYAKPVLDLLFIVCLSLTVLIYFLCDITDSSFVPPLIYAFMGSSRDIAIGPVAVVSLLLGSMLQHEIDPVKQKLEYQRLAFTATFFAGITQFVLGFFRLFNAHLTSILVLLDNRCHDACMIKLTNFFSF